MSQTHWGLMVERQYFDVGSIDRVGQNEWVGMSEEEPDRPPSALQLSPSKTYPDISVPFEPLEGEELYLLYVSKYAGDSMTTERGIFEAITAYRSLDKALLAQHAIKAHALWRVSLANDSRLAILDDQDRLMRVQVSWSGYFEGLENVIVVKVPVTKAK